MAKIVRAGKFMMRILTWVIVAPDTNDKSVFKGITGVEGTLKEFKKINALLKRYPVYPPFDLSDMENEQ